MSVRRPRAFLSTGIGIIVPLDVQVTLTKTQSSDTFRSTFPLQTNQPDYWASAAPLPVTVTIDGKQVFEGKVDQVEANYASDKISISGRCNSADMIDSKSNESFRNQRRGDVVRTIAGRFGLQAQVDQAVDLAGTTFHAESAHLTDGTSYWTLIQSLAELDGKVAFVRGNILHYVDPNDAALGSIDLFHVPRTPASHRVGNWTELKFSRNVKLGKTINVRVTSWHPQRREGVTIDRVLPGAGGSLSYHYRHSQLSRGQAGNIADRRLRENAANEVSCSFNVPGNVGLDPRGKVRVHGTAFDQEYEISQVTHEISQGNGFRSSGKAQSQSSRRGGGQGGNVPLGRTPDPHET